ncbi:MAG: UbiD family decarboxylase [Fibromonadaceae bacterium]|jgi:4-hydroxy-3-polyprenylbenzoate decarboxylase|nr:UbiD family decarboxylase [Fibromonadaceae bacterium]
MPSLIRKACEVLEKHGELVRIKEPVSPNLAMADIALKAFAEGGPAVFFEKVEGSRFPAVCNLFGSERRAELLLKGRLNFDLKNANRLFHSLPQRSLTKPVMQQEISLSDLPQIKCWPRDGGAFLTLPQVLTIKPGKKSWLHSNVGMYRVQISGGDYAQNECGLHYQIHRGIGIHHQEALERGEKLKVSIFVGGPPGNTLAAVMPLPNGVSELSFAGMFSKRAFRYTWYKDWLVSTDADFCILGEVQSNLKPEGPFGDHLGYYSEQHPFPYLKVHKVFARKDAVFPFTVVGRPPQEDTIFGNLIHKITAPFISKVLPGVHEVNAVDAAGVHPLLLALGSERYLPYEKREPLELLTQSNAILGFGQLSLAKYLFIAAKEDNPNLSVNNIPEFFEHILCRINLERDIQIHKSTSIDTLDYTGTSLNRGSKAVFAAAGEPCRELGSASPIRGVLVVVGADLRACPNNNQNTEKFPLVILCDDAEFTKKNLNNLLWVTFTRSNPATDISFSNNQVIIDARKKPHHAEELQMPQRVGTHSYGCVTQPVNICN